MTEDDKKLLNSFEGKLQYMLFLYGKLQDENKSLRKLVDEKEAEITGLKENVEVLEKRYADLKAARIIGINDNELKDTKQRLTKLVREVDKCIALLGE